MAQLVLFRDKIGCSLVLKVFSLLIRKQKFKISLSGDGRFWLADVIFRVDLVKTRYAEKPMSQQVNI